MKGNSDHNCIVQSLRSRSSHIILAYIVETSKVCDVCALESMLLFAPTDV